jgi:hypothetical protein
MLPRGFPEASPEASPELPRGFPRRSHRRCPELPPLVTARTRAPPRPGTARPGTPPGPRRDRRGWRRRPARAASGVKKCEVRTAAAFGGRSMLNLSRTRSPQGGVTVTGKCSASARCARRARWFIQPTHFRVLRKYDRVIITQDDLPVCITPYWDRATVEPRHPQPGRANQFSNTRRGVGR